MNGDAKLRQSYAAASARTTVGHVDEATWERLACGEADEAERTRAFDHVNRCGECAAVYRSLVQLQGEALAFDPTRPEAPALRPGVVGPRSSRPAPWALSLAAAVVVGFGAGVVSVRLTADRSAEEEEARRLAGRVGALQAEVRRLRDGESTLRGEVERLQAPALNLPVVELLPDASVPRGAKAPETLIRVPRDARLLAIVLGSEDPRAGPASVELRDARGQVLWRGTGLQPSRVGFTLGLPVSLLREGSYGLVLRPARGAPTTHSIRVERQR